MESGARLRLSRLISKDKSLRDDDNDDISMGNKAVSSPDSAEDARKRLSRLVEKVSQDSSIPTLKSNDISTTFSVRRTLLDFDNRTVSNQVQRARSASPTATHDFVTNRKQIEKLAKHEIELMQEEHFQKETLLEKKWHDDLVQCQNLLNQAKSNAQKEKIEREYINLSKHSLLMLASSNNSRKLLVSKAYDLISQVFDSYKVFENGPISNKTDLNDANESKLQQSSRIWFFLHDDSDGFNSKRMFTMSSKIEDRNVNKNYSILHETFDRNHPIMTLISSLSGKQPQSMIIDDFATVSWLLAQHSSNNKEKDNISSRYVADKCLPILFTSFSLCPSHSQEEFSQHHYAHRVRCVLIIEQYSLFEQSVQLQHMQQVSQIVQDIFYRTILQQEKEFQRSILSSTLSQNNWMCDNSFEHTKFTETAATLVKSLQEWFINALNIQKATLLLSTDVMKTLGLNNESEDHYLLFKLKSFDSNVFQPIWDSKQQQFEYPWYKDLREGKIVIFNPSNSEMYARQNTASYYNSNQDTVQYSRLTLQSFLLSVDDNAKAVSSSMLVPITTPFGLLVLILGDRCANSFSLLDDIEFSVAPNYSNVNNTLPFTASYANSISPCISSLSSMTSSMILSLAQKYNNIHYVGLLERKLINSQRKCDLYLASWDLSRNYQLKKHFYAVWKKIVDQIKAEKKMKVIKTVGEMVRDLLDFRNFSVSSINNHALTEREYFTNQYVTHFELFLSRVEYCLRKSFPLDYVILINNNSQKAETLVENVQSLYGRGESFETLTESIQFLQLGGRCCNVSILLQRNFQQNGKLTDSEKLSFTECCNLINSVYVALHIGFQESNFVDFAYASLEHCEIHLSDLSIERKRNESANEQLENIRSELNGEIIKNREVANVKSLLTLIINTFSDLAFLSDSHEQLSLNVWKLLPQLFNCESALLVLNEVHTRPAVNAQSHKFKIMWPTDKGVLQIVSKVNQQTCLSSGKSDPEYLSLNQLMNIPQYELCGPAQEQSAILLRSPENELFGALLIFRTIEKGNFFLTSPSVSNEMLNKFTSSVIYPKIIAFRCGFLQDERDKLEKWNENLHSNVKQKELVIEELKNKIEVTESTYADAFSRYESLHSKFIELEKLQQVSVSNLTSELEVNKQYYENIIMDLNACSKKLENSSYNLQQQNEVMNEHKNALLQISEKFAYDDRCHQERYVWYWLREIAQSRQSQFYYFCDKLSNGSLHKVPTGSSHNEFTFPEAFYHDVNGLFASIGESNRTGKYVHFKSVLASSFSNLDRSNSFFASNVGSEVDILCVPNRASLDNTNRQSAYPGCFLFFKHSDSKLWKGFSKEDCDILEFACNIVSRALVKEYSVSVPEDYTELKRCYQLSQLNIKVLLDSIVFGKSLLDKPLRSLHDLGSYIKEAILGLCSEDAFNSFLSGQYSTYDSVFVVISSSFDKRLKSFSSSAQELITKAKSSRTLQHNGTMLVFPMVLSQDKVFGIVIIEKKIILSDGSSNKEKESLSLQNLSISDIELEVFSILLCFVTYMLDKVSSMKDALQSIQEAAFAVNAVESNRLISEDRLTTEISVRLQYEEVLKRGQELFSRVSTKRTNIGQLFDLVRSSVLTIASATDCFILLPYSATTLFHDVLFEVYDEMNATDVNPWLEKVRSGSGYYTLIPNEDVVLDVKLESGDIEAVALSSNRAVFFPSKSGESERSTNFSVWQSWGIRRVQANICMPQDFTNDHYQSLFSLVVPFSVHQKQLSVEDPRSNQGLVGAIVAVRTTSPFLDSDRECITHLNHILSSCFKIKQGAIQTESKVFDIEKLQQELFSLKTFKQLQQLQLDDQIAGADNITQFDNIPDIVHSLSTALNLPKDSHRNNLIDSNNFENILSQHLDEYFETLFQKLFPLFTIISCTEVEWSDLRIMKSGNLDSGATEFRKEFTLKQFGSMIVKFGLLSKDGGNVIERIISAELQKSKSLQLFEKTQVVLVRLQIKSRILYFVAFTSTTTITHEKSLMVVHESYLNLRFAYLAHCLEVFYSFSKSHSEMSQKLQQTFQSTENTVAILEEEKTLAVEKVNHLEKKFSEFVKTEKSLLHEIAEKKREKLKRFEGTIVKLNMLQSNMLKEITECGEDINNGVDILCRTCIELGNVIECKTAIGKLMNSLLEKQQNSRFQCEWIHNLNSISLPHWMLQKVCDIGNSDKINFVIATDKPPTKEILSIDIYKECSTIKLHVETTTDGSNFVGAYFPIPARENALSTSFIIIYQFDSQLKSLHVPFLQCLQNLILVFYNFQEKKFGTTLMKELEEKLTISKRKTQIMDQVTADWTELVKGLNSSSSAVVAGVKGFWARAANTIVSILSSNCLIRNCGLILQDNSKERNLLELIVRDLSSPYYPAQNVSLSDETEIASLMEYANTNIEQRPARELGSKIHLMLLDIFDKHSTEQRIYKTIYDTNPQLLSAKTEQSVVRIMYFVPVRSAYNIHGVLRLNIELSFSNNENTKFIHDQSTMLSSIENNMVNFAEVFAPLLITSRRMEEHRFTKELIEGENRDKHNQIADIISKIQHSEECNSLFFQVIEECSKLSCSRGTTGALIFHNFCEELLVRIQSILRCDVDLIVHPELMEGLQFQQNSSFTITGDATSNSIENKSILFSTRKSTVNSQKHEFDDAKVTSILMLSSGEIAGKLIIYFDNTMQRRKMESSIPAISQFLTAILREAVVEQSAKDKVVLAVDSLKIMKETVEKEQLRFSSLFATTEELKFQLQQQIEWTKLTSESLKYVTSIENHSYRLPVLQNMIPYSLNSFSHLFDYLLSTLLSLGNVLFPQVCFNIAVINNDTKSELRATDSGQQLIWLYGEREDMPLSWSKLSESSKAVARNIVNLCLMQRLKSDIEIRQPVQTSSDSLFNESSKTIHVMALPLWHSYTGSIIGALVILQHAESFNCLSDGYSKLCDIGSVISRVISHEIVEYVVEESYIHQEVNLISRDSKVEELEKLVASQQTSFENQKELQSREIANTKSRINNLKTEVEKYDSLIASQLSKESSTKQEFTKVLLNFVNNIKSCYINRGFTVASGDQLFLQCYNMQRDDSDFIKHHIINTVTAVEKSIENIFELGMSKRYHVSVIARKERFAISSPKMMFGELADLLVFSSKNYVGEECLLISRSKLKAVNAQNDVFSYIENCFRGSTKQIYCGENLSQLSPTDLLGVNSSNFAGKDYDNGNVDTVVTIFCIGLKFSLDAPDVDAVIRLIVQDERSASIHNQYEKSDYSFFLKQAEYELQKLLISQTLEACSSISDMSLISVQNFVELEQSAKNQELVHIQEKDTIEDMKSIFSRYRKLYKVVCRESTTLLDPPVIGSEHSTARASHPANITPIAALQDSCLKILSLLRNLLRSEGQAILLKDLATSPTTYQIIYSGNALSWPGIEPNTFGVITSRTKHEFVNVNLRSSLVETAILGRKSLLVANAPLDDRYFSQTDGICALGTPLLVCPLKGRNGIIVGAVVVAKSKDSLPFSIEDVAAAELIVGMGALSIYWCQGLGSMHHQLLKTVEKMERLEKSIVAK